MGMRASIFRENRKEMASYKLFWPIIFCSFDRIDVFNQIWAWLHGVVHKKILNNDMRAPCFLNFTFLTKYGHDSSLFSKNGRFFDKIWEWQQWFFVKIGKKATYWLFWSIIKCSFVRIDTFLTKYGHDNIGFSWKFEKNDMREPCFWKNGRFLTNYEHESRLIYRERTFLSYGVREMIFSWKLRKKRASYLLF